MSDCARCHTPFLVGDSRVRKENEGGQMHLLEGVCIDRLLEEIDRLRAQLAAEFGLTGTNSRLEKWLIADGFHRTLEAEADLDGNLRVRLLDLHRNFEKEGKSFPGALAQVLDEAEAAL